MAAVLVIGAVLLGPQCMAQVLTTVEEAGPADCVYIAGNPDLYPIEYYDSEQQCCWEWWRRIPGSPLPM